jgi:hypothetical protein
MLNEEVADLYLRTPIGTRVVVLAENRAAPSASRPLPPAGGPMPPAGGPYAPRALGGPIR